MIPNKDNRPPLPSADRHISGGFIMVPRTPLEPEDLVAGAPPCVREVWLYLNLNANYSDNPPYNRRFAKGQILVHCSELRERLSWYVGYRKMMYHTHQIGNALKWLRKHNLIASTRTTRGTVVTICNYALYQDGKNYEHDTENASGDRTNAVRTPPVKQEGIRKKEDSPVRVINITGYETFHDPRLDPVDLLLNVIGETENRVTRRFLLKCERQLGKDWLREYDERKWAEFNHDNVRNKGQVVVKELKDILRFRSGKHRIPSVDSVSPQSPDSPASSQTAGSLSGTPVVDESAHG